MATIVNRNDIILQATSPRVVTIPIIIDYSDLTDNLGIQPDDNADVTLVNTAANVTGQTGFATLDKINSGNVGTYIDNLAIKNAQISTAAIGTANIIDANVSTLKIQGNAVTVPTFASNMGNLTTISGWQTAIQVSIAVTGTNPVKILGLANANSFVYDGGTGATFLNQSFYTRLLRDGTVLATASTSVGSVAMLGAAYTDTPSAGTYTYKFQTQIVLSGVGSKFIYNRSISVMEVKR